MSDAATGDAVKSVRAEVLQLAEAGPLAQPADVEVRLTVMPLRLNTLWFNQQVGGKGSAYQPIERLGCLRVQLNRLQVGRIVSQHRRQAEGHDGAAGRDLCFNGTHHL